MMEVRMEPFQNYQDSAAELGMSLEEWLNMAALRQSIRQMDPENAEGIIAGLEADAAGDYATEEEVKSVFAKLRGQNG